MTTLAEGLQISKSNLLDFKQTADRVLDYLPAVITEEVKYSNYTLCSSTIAGAKKRIRPFNNSLFLRETKVFENEYDNFIEILHRLKKGVRQFEQSEYAIIDRVEIGRAHV